jgi:hypothetical protein
MESLEYRGIMYNGVDNYLKGDGDDDIKSSSKLLSDPENILLS